MRTAAEGRGVLVFLSTAAATAAREAAHRPEQPDKRERGLEGSQVLEGSWARGEAGPRHSQLGYARSARVLPRC